MSNRISLPPELVSLCLQHLPIQDHVEPSSTRLILQPPSSREIVSYASPELHDMMQPWLLRKVRVPISYHISTSSRPGHDSLSVIDDETRKALSDNAREVVLYSMRDIQFLVSSSTVLPNVHVIHIKDEFQSRMRLASAKDGPTKASQPLKALSSIFPSCHWISTHGTKGQPSIWAEQFVSQMKTVKRVSFGYGQTSTPEVAIQRLKALTTTGNRSHPLTVDFQPKEDKEGLASEHDQLLNSLYEFAKSTISPSGNQYTIYTQAFGTTMPDGYEEVDADSSQSSLGMVIGKIPDSSVRGASFDPGEYCRSTGRITLKRTKDISDQLQSQS